MYQSSSEDISVQTVFDEISKYLKNEKLFERLQNILHEEPSYKRLLKTGENQFFDAPNESSIEAESVKSRLSCTEINVLALNVEDDIDKIVQEKFQGEFLDNLKDEVLQAILQLSSDQVNNSSAKSLASPDKSKKYEEILSLSKINSDHDLIFSFDDVSSVHTSDLSSFEDEISLSSDEEFGEKRRLSLKEVQEKLEKSQPQIVESEADGNKVKSNQAEDVPCNGNESCSKSLKSQRRRKPNLKYIYEDDAIPLKKKFTGKVSKLSRSASGNTPRKRGRPRKHSA